MSLGYTKEAAIKLSITKTLHDIKRTLDVPIDSILAIYERVNNKIHAFKYNGQYDFDQEIERDTIKEFRAQIDDIVKQKH